MRVIPDILAARLGGATTLCHCWRLLLRDGARLGFTDHDQDLTFDGLTHAAASGLDASDAESSLGFGAAGAEVNGALMAAALTESDLMARRSRPGLWIGCSPRRDCCWILAPSARPCVRTPLLQLKCARWRRPLMSRVGGCIKPRAPQIWATPAALLRSRRRRCR